MCLICKKKEVIFTYEKGRLDIHEILFKGITSINTLSNMSQNILVVPRHAWRHVTILIKGKANAQNIRRNLFSQGYIMMMRRIIYVNISKYVEHFYCNISLLCHQGLSETSIIIIIWKHRCGLLIVQHLAHTIVFLIKVSSVNASWLTSIAQQLDKSIVFQIFFSNGNFDYSDTTLKLTLVIHQIQIQ